MLAYDKPASNSTINGTRSQVARTSLNPTAYVGGIVAVRGENQASGGMIQTGYVHQGGNYTSADCGHFTLPRVIVERHTDNAPLPGPAFYHCTTYTSHVDANDRFAVIAGAVNGSWLAYENGSVLGGVTYHPGMTYVSAMVVGEYTSDPDHLGSMYVEACFGCDGLQSWDYSQDKGNHYTKVPTPYPALNTNQEWTLPPHSTPLTIHD